MLQASSRRFSTSTARLGPCQRLVGGVAARQTVVWALGGRSATRHQAPAPRVLWCSAAGDSAIPNNDNRQGPADKTSSSLDSALAGLDKMLGVEEEKPVEMMPEEEENPTITVPLLWRGGGGGSSVAASLDPTSVAAAEYCGLTLKFPQRATPSQKERGLAGVELDFVLVRQNPIFSETPFIRFMYRKAYVFIQLALLPLGRLTHPILRRRRRPLLVRVPSMHGQAAVFPHPLRRDEIEMP